MAMMSPRGGNGVYRPLAEINVTPLVDVMLVLLIIFMVTAPMLASGMKVNLPQAKQVQPLDPKTPIIITVGKDHTISLAGDVIEPDKLIDDIQQKLGSDINQVIHLRGDKEAYYGEVVTIMDLLATNGLTHIAIVADPHSKKNQANRSDVETKPAANPSIMVPVDSEVSPAVPSGSMAPAVQATSPSSAPSSSPTTSNSSAASRSSDIP